jgi:hypothetical protein
MTIEKVIRDGKVAVLVSEGYGAGWYTWHGIEALLFDPVIVGMVETMSKSNNADFKATYDAIVKYAKEKYGDCHCSYSGIAGLIVEWAPVGEKFRIHEYDGSETLILESGIGWITA